MEASISICPNPVVANATLILSGIKGNVALKIFDGAGRAVRNWPVVPVINTRVSISGFSDLGPGIYFMEVKTAKQSTLVKVIKR